jgi:hypothetical protein
MDGATLPLSMALALKHGADPKPYMAISAAYDRYHAPMIAFVGIATRSDPLASETMLLGRVPMEIRAYAYNAGMVLLGPKTPPPGQFQPPPAVCVGKTVLPLIYFAPK